MDGFPRAWAVVVALALCPVAAAAGAPMVAATAGPVETSVADFSGGALDDVMITEADNGADGGQLRLPALIDDIFLDGALDTAWAITIPAYGYEPVIEDGIIDVQERDDTEYLTSAFETGAVFEAGVVCEARVQIHAGSAFANFGFTSSTRTPDQWAYFSTRGSGNGPVPVLYTSTNTATTNTVNVPTAVSLGEWHVFKIIWTPDRLEFFVDGALVDTRTDVDITLPQHLGLYKSGDSDSPLLVDWVRVTPYTAATGAYESAVMDAGTAASPWTTLSWQGDEPAGTTVAFLTRTGESATPDETWSPWSACIDGVVDSPSARFAQYRAELATTDSLAGPVVDEVRLLYTYPDVTPPTVAATIPPAGAIDIRVDAPVSATFSEAVDPATLTPSSVLLTPPAGSPVAATLEYDAATFCVTLTPELPLDHDTAYTAILATAITDLEGNPLAANHLWTFTTEAPDLTPPAVIATTPADGAVDVLAGRLVTATFSEAVDPASVTSGSVTVTPAGGSAIAATVLYDAAGTRVILDPAVDLEPATTYELRLTTAITDLAGIPLSGDKTVSFVTRAEAPSVAIATTTADFSVGAHDGTMAAEIDNGAASGQIRLAALLEDRFESPVLDPQWDAVNPDGYAPVIEGGILDVQERDDEVYTLSSIESLETFGPAVVMEARAMFVPGSKYIDIGLDNTTRGNSQYAWFSSGGTGDQGEDARIVARVREYDHTTTAIETGATYNEWHVFKIVWTPAHLEFYVDGELVASQSDVLITSPLRAAFYKERDSDTPLLVDWVRVTPLAGASGSYTSPVVDSGRANSAWVDLQWTGSTPDLTSVTCKTRTGETAVPDDSWSAWTTVDGGDVTSPRGRYAQYRLALASDDPHASPAIDEVQLSYDVDLDSTPPVVLTTTPASGSENIDPATSICAEFDEPIDAATLTAESFVLELLDGTVVPTTMSYDTETATATLEPVAILAGAEIHRVRLTTAVTDVAGNPLAADIVWTFTTRTVVAVGDDLTPTVTALRPAAPNPFNPVTTIRFDIAADQDVHVRIYGVDGRLVRTLVSGRQAAGRHAVVWNGTDDRGRGVATGTYLMRLETRDVVQTGKISLVK